MSLTHSRAVQAGSYVFSTFSCLLGLGTGELFCLLAGGFKVEEATELEPVDVVVVLATAGGFQVPIKPAAVIALALCIS
eukprot:g35867.t1